MSVLYWSKGSDPDKFPDINSVGIHGVKVIPVLGSHYVDFWVGSHRCRMSLRQILVNGTAWANRKLYRFRRYARRMSR